MSMGDVMAVVCSTCGYPALMRRGPPEAWAPKGAAKPLPCPVCERDAKIRELEGSTEKPKAKVEISALWTKPFRVRESTSVGAVETIEARDSRHAAELWGERQHGANGERLAVVGPPWDRCRDVEITVEAMDFTQKTFWLDWVLDLVGE